MTPYAVLLCKPTDDDKTIRKAYHALVRDEHPDANDGEVGEQWTTLTNAYNATKTDETRSRWAAKQFLLAGQCDRCGGTGVQGTRKFRGKIRLCDGCQGLGRVR